MNVNPAEQIPEIIMSPLLACFCGGFLGWNREVRGRAAGLRTQILVCLGACLFTMATLELQREVLSAYPDGDVDPIRVIAGVIGGIGFLGAGSIIQSGSTIKGMTTAATVWVVGAIGVACGLRLFLLALIGFAFTAITLIGLGWLETAVKSE